MAVPALNPYRTLLKSPPLYTSSACRNYHSALQIRCAKGGGTKPKKKKIVFFDQSPPPPVLDEKPKKKISSGNGGGPIWGFVKRAPRKALALLANLPLALGEMGALASLMALATFIEQDESKEFYMNKYPAFWRWILIPGFDHMWVSPVFLGLVILLASSLMACTYTTQIPLVKVARRWSFMHSADTIKKLEFSDSLADASIQDLGTILMGKGYEVFLKGPSLYAFKGLAGRLAPIGVHLAMLLIMGGATWTAGGSYKGAIKVPQGLNFVVGDVVQPTGFLATPLDSFNTEVHVNRFYMEYYESGEVSQFYTDLSLFDLNGNEVFRKTIKVNDPLRYGGLTIYQTDWGISALQITRNGEGPFNLAVARLAKSGDNKMYGSFLPTGDASDSGATKVKGISMLMRDLQSIVLYDEEGKFVGVRRPSSKLPIEVNGNQIVIEDAIGTSGLDIKMDPGVPIVYAGFGALMLTTSISFLSHSQIWALQDGSTVVIGGKTNRAKIEFSEEINRLLDKVPELVNSDDALKI
ncbi:hypothetical protein LUZ60_010420 [Juncus effusus]|nr:hypothetical protein LUZ60_010420 [Juncus effusus]